MWDVWDVRDVTYCTVVLLSTSTIVPVLQYKSNSTVQCSSTSYSYFANRSQTTITQLHCICNLQRSAIKPFWSAISLSFLQSDSFRNDEEAKMIALEATRITGLDIAGVDLLFDDNGHYKVCEINSSPGFKGLNQATGQNIAHNILKYITIFQLI